MNYLTLLCGLLMTTSVAHSAQVELELRTTQTSYRIGQSITFDFVFKNRSAEAITLFPDPESYELQTISISPVADAGVVEEIELAERSMDWKAWSKDAVVLPPGGVHVWRLEAHFRRHLPADWKEFLQSEFERERPSNSYLIFAGEAFRLPGFGKYNVIAKYKFQRDHPVADYIRGEPKLWFGELTSAPITIALRQ